MSYHYDDILDTDVYYDVPDDYWDGPSFDDSDIGIDPDIARDIQRERYVFPEDDTILDDPRPWGGDIGWVDEYVVKTYGARP